MTQFLIQQSRRTARNSTPTAFADYKEKVVDFLMRITAVSEET